MFLKILLPIDVDLAARLKIGIRDYLVVDTEVKASLRKSANASDQQIPQITNETPSVDDAPADERDPDDDVVT